MSMSISQSFVRPVRTITFSVSYQLDHVKQFLDLFQTVNIVIIIIVIIIESVSTHTRPPMIDPPKASDTHGNASSSI